MTQEKLMAVAEQLEGISKERSLAVLGNVGQFKKAFMVASAIRNMKNLLTNEVMAPIMELQNTSLGFRADATYPVEVVKEAIIEASIRGLQPVGNQFNIIAKRCYITKEGFTYLMKNLPGLTDLKLIPSVPVMVAGGATVKYKATWTYDGKPDSIEREIPVKVNSGMGADAVLGKAERKIRAAIYGQITGTNISDGEVSEDDSGSIPTTATKHDEPLPETMAERLAKAQNKKTDAPKKKEPTDAQKLVIGLDSSVFGRVFAKLKYPAEITSWTDEQCSTAMNMADCMMDEDAKERERGF